MNHKVKKTVFIDGQHGTVGLKIHERLEKRTDIELISIPEEKRKDTVTKKQILNEADFVFLCLPDDAARESVSLISNPNVCVIDGSTAHRTAPGWIYGLPEMSPGQRDLIKQSQRISVPGCHATGFVLLLYPLVAEKILPPDYPVSVSAIAGYSGGGKSMIAQYDTPHAPADILNPRPYALTLKHKHVPEMTKVVGLSHPVLFYPTVVNVYNGEIISVPIYTGRLKGNLAAADVQQMIAEYYDGENFVKVMPYPADAHLKNGFLTMTDCNGTNNIEIFIFGGKEHILLSARFDNLGKGASGAAVQNLNIKLGVAEATGL